MVKDAPRIGLALSSGGAKGLAHVGVIQVLEENGIYVDVVAGCSMGAYVAAVWGAGHDGQFMEHLACQVKSRWGVWKLVDPVFPPRKGFMLGHAIRRRLCATIGDARFEDLARPIRIVATDLDTLDRVVFASGEVAAAVHASIAIPGVCAPVSIEGRSYVDGGIADPMPVDVLRELGVEKVIAVNTIPTPAVMHAYMERDREAAARCSRRRSLARFLNSHINYFARGNILDTMMRAVHGAQIRVAEAACSKADLVVRPLSIDARWYEFDKPGKYIAIGRRAAEECLAEIKALVSEPIPTHENDKARNTMATVA